MSLNILDQAPALIVAIPLLAAFATPLISRFSRLARNFWVIGSLFLTLILVYNLAGDIFDNGPRTYVFGSSDTKLVVPSGASVPIRIVFAIDGFGAFMGIVGITIAVMAAIYSWAFIYEDGGVDKYYTLLLLMVVGMMGMFYTGDFFNLFVFLEILSISSAALVGYNIARGEGSEAGFKYLVISSIAGLIVLAAVGIFYGQYNALNMAEIGRQIEFSGFAFVDKIALVLLITAFAMKAGAAPMHMWLPDAYGESPAPVSIVLVCASQASMYALFRIIFTVYGGVIDAGIVGWIVIILALVSMFIGVVMALIQSDLKRLIAYTALAETGFILLAFGVAIARLGSIYTLSTGDYGFGALQGGIFHIFNDALDVGLLFLVAGSIYKVTGERNINKMGGLARNMKITTVLFVIGALAIAGIPPMNGFASKLMIYESVFRFNPLLAVIALFASIIMLANFVRVFQAVFLGPEFKIFKNVGDPGTSMLTSMMTITIIMIVFGLFSYLVVDGLVTPAAKHAVDWMLYRNRVLGQCIWSVVRCWI